MVGMVPAAYNTKIRMDYRPTGAYIHPTWSLTNLAPTSTPTTTTYVGDPSYEMEHAPNSCLASDGVLRDGGVMITLTTLTASSRLDDGEKKLHGAGKRGQVPARAAFFHKMDWFGWNYHYIVRTPPPKANLP